ncbi:hypothetical protein [Kitasatospora sp. NPDC093679]|uniref:hypothetical protein n=1 Tax=Kitasatospora sp. NPDC093679 TaxID=3154983 RepID=UPI003431F919
MGSEGGALWVNLTLVTCSDNGLTEQHLVFTPASASKRYVLADAAAVQVIELGQGDALKKTTIAAKQLTSYRLIDSEYFDIRRDASDTVTAMTEIHSRPSWSAG